MGYIGMCGPKGYGFSAVLAINRVQSTILVINRVWFLHIVVMDSDEYKEKVAVLLNDSKTYLKLTDKRLNPTTSVEKYCFAEHFSAVFEFTSYRNDVCRVMHSFKVA